MKKLGIVLVVVLTGCASLGVGSEYNVVSKTYDTLEGPMKVHYLELYSDWFDTIGIQWYDTHNGPDYLSIEVVYRGGDWRFIDHIDLAIDGEIHEFDDPLIDRDVLSGGSVREEVTILITPELYDAFATVESLRIQYHGEPETIERTDWVRRFMAEVVNG